MELGVRVLNDSKVLCPSDTSQKAILGGDSGGDRPYTLGEKFFGNPTP